jgi:two-component system LytT family response regulator
VAPASAGGIGVRNLRERLARCMASVPAFEFANSPGRRAGRSETAMRILIVDDERPARDKAAPHAGGRAGISAIEEARDGVEALERLPAFAPDLLLLDIQMPEVTGLDVAASLPAPAPLVVFVTAYDEYAIRAFDANAIDYLLKPYDQPRLQRRCSAYASASATAAAATAAGADAQPGSHGAANCSYPAPLPAVTQLLVPERSGTRIVKVEQILWIETADNYVILHTAEGEPLMRQTLAGLLEKLGPRFMRCHRRAAVRLLRSPASQILKRRRRTYCATAARALSRQYRRAGNPCTVAELRRNCPHHPPPSGAPDYPLAPCPPVSPHRDGRPQRHNLIWLH